MQDSTKEQQINIEDLLGYNYIETRDAIGERALWQSVIMQAVLDVLKNPSDIRERMERAKTIAWFSFQNEDFMSVCSFAGMDPDCIIKGVKNIARQQKKQNKRHSSSYTRRFHKVYRPNYQNDTLTELA